MSLGAPLFYLGLIILTGSLAYIVIQDVTIWGLSEDEKKNLQPAPPSLYLIGSIVMGFGLFLGGLIIQANELGGKSK